MISDEGARWLNTRPDGGWCLRERGTYTYGFNAVTDSQFKPTSVMEQYVIWVQDTSDTALDTAPEYKLIRACRDALSTPYKIELRVESRSRGDGLKMTFEARTSSEPRARVEYRVDQDRLKWARVIPRDLATHISELDLAEGTIILPLMRNFLGAVIHEVSHRRGGQASILVPELTDPHADSVFTPTIGMRSATLALRDSEHITLADRTWDCLVYRFVGGPYDDNSTFWVCQQSHRLIRYIFDAPTGDRWSAELSRLDSCSIGSLSQ